MQVIQTRLEDAIRLRDFVGLRDAVEGLTPSDLADVIGELPAERQATAFRILPRATAAATFEYLPHDKQEELLKSLAQEDVAAILNDMSPDDRTMLLEELPATVTIQLLSLLDEKERAVAVRLLGYPENSVGRFMTPEYIAVRPDWTVRQVLDYVRKHGQDKETLNLVYVMDDDGVLIDDVRMRRFLLSDPEQRVLVVLLRPLWAALVSGRRHGRPGARRHSDVGGAGRLDVTAGPAAARLRPNFVFGPLRRDTCGRDGVGHIFQRCGDHPARHIVVRGHFFILAPADRNVYSLRLRLFP